MVFRPDSSPGPPPAAVEMPAPKQRTFRRRAGAKEDAPATRHGTQRRAKWQQQKRVLDLLSVIAEAGNALSERRRALRKINQLITAEPEAQRIFVTRCSEEPALEEAIRELLPSTDTVQSIDADMEPEPEPEPYFEPEPEPEPNFEPEPEPEPEPSFAPRRQPLEPRRPTSANASRSDTASKGVRRSGSDLAAAARGARLAALAPRG